jgi:hypothetical protein
LAIARTRARITVEAREAMKGIASMTIGEEVGDSDAVPPLTSRAYKLGQTGYTVDQASSEGSLDKADGSRLFGGSLYLLKISNRAMVEPPG